MSALKLCIGSLFAALYWRNGSGATMNESAYEDYTDVGGQWNYYDAGPDTWHLNYSYCSSNFTSQSGRNIDFTTVKNGFNLTNNTVDPYDNNLFNHWDWTPDQTRWEIKNTGYGLEVVK